MKNKEILDNLPKVMKDDILTRTRMTRTIRGTSFRRIPSIDDFQLGSKKLNSILQLVDLKRFIRLKPKLLINQFRNCNRYMRWEIRRAKKQLEKNNFKGFWIIATRNLEKSLSFRLSAVYRVLPHWYYTMSVKRISSVLNRVDRIIKKWDTEVEFYRVYIPKSNGKQRPLGVPSPEWRICSHMLTCWLTEYYKDTVSQYNHAYIPGKGTLTAWKDLLTKVLREKNIFEFDLKSFFDNVDITGLRSLMEKSKVPENICRYIESINMCTPRNMNKVQEDSIHLKNLFNEVQGRLETGWGEMEITHEETVTLKGLPQGLNSSPILSILTLLPWYDDLKKQGNKLLMYADDGLIYSRHDIDVTDRRINWDKSRWLKKDGVWLVDEFTFLGLKYNVKEDLLSGNTRKGSTLKFDTARKGLFDIISILKKLNPKYTTNSELLASTNVFGLIQSRLYDDNWQTVYHPEKEWRILKNSLWSDLGKTNRDLLSGPGSIYFLADLIKSNMKKR